MTVKQIKFGVRVSTVENGGMIALDRPNQAGWFPVCFPGQYDQTMRIHTAEVINLYK